MSAVVGVARYSERDGGGSTVSIERAPGVGRSTIHTVDIGDTEYRLGEVTHLSRDGQWIVALYSPEHGWAVSVHTGEPS